MRPLAAILAFLAAAAGWFYLFYDRHAAALGGIEDQSLNRRRIRLRRINGVGMFLLGVCLFALCWSVEPADAPLAGMLLLLAVLFLLMMVVTLALMDVRLTVTLRRRQRERAENRNNPPPPEDESMRNTMR